MPLTFLRLAGGPSRLGVYGLDGCEGRDGDAMVDALRFSTEMDMLPRRRAMSRVV